MRRFGRLSWAVPFVPFVVFAALGSASVVGCSGGGEVHLGTPPAPPPPPPPPPPPDQDGDGIADPDDKCPTEKEDGVPPDTKDGCPDKDADKDGIPIPADKCPDKPETVNGFEDEDGCPDEKPLVQLKETEVQINQKIQFGKDKATIEKESTPVLDAVAELLKKNPELQLTEIGGHASKEGDEKHNEQLTQKRVEAVVDALAKKGVDKNRMLAQGYGSYCPIDPGTTEEALEKNRRVEFKILYRKGKDLGQKRGCDGAEKAKLKLKPVPALKPYTEEKVGDTKAKGDAAAKADAAAAKAEGKAEKAEKAAAKAEAKGDKAEAKADKAEAKADKAEAKADKAEAKADKAEAKGAPAAAPAPPKPAPAAPMAPAPMK